VKTALIVGNLTPFFSNNGGALWGTFLTLWHLGQRLRDYSTTDVITMPLKILMPLKLSDGKQYPIPFLILFRSSDLLSVHHIHTTPRKVAYSLFFEPFSLEIPGSLRN
jgi:hypothetical protein